MDGKRTGISLNNTSRLCFNALPSGEGGKKVLQKDETKEKRTSDGPAGGKQKRKNVSIFRGVVTEKEVRKRSEGIIQFPGERDSGEV